MLLGECGLGVLSGGWLPAPAPTGGPGWTVRASIPNQCRWPAAFHPCCLQTAWGCGDLSVLPPRGAACAAGRAPRASAGWGWQPPWPETLCSGHPSTVCAGCAQHNELAAGLQPKGGVSPSPAPGGVSWHSCPGRCCLSPHRVSGGVCTGLAWVWHKQSKPKGTRCPLGTAIVLKPPGSPRQEGAAAPLISALAPCGPVPGCRTAPEQQDTSSHGCRCFSLP